MSGVFYDAWAHGAHLVAKRVLRTLLLGVALGLVAWALALHGVHGGPLWDVAAATVSIGEATPELRGVFWLSLILGQVLAFWALSVAWLWSSRGVSASHQRGARVVDGEVH